MNIILAIITVVIGCIVGTVGGLFLKKGADICSLKTFMINKNIIAGISLYAISMILFLAALKGNPLSVLYPFVSTQYIWVALFSMKFLGEKMNTMKWAGITCIIIGVVCIGFGT